MINNNDEQCTRSLEDIFKETVRIEKMLTVCAVCGTEIKFTSGTIVTLTMRDSETPKLNNPYHIHVRE